VIVKSVFESGRQVVAGFCGVVTMPEIEVYFLLAGIKP
jgi:hypothetical protein